MQCSQHSLCDISNLSGRTDVFEIGEKVAILGRRADVKRDYWMAGDFRILIKRRGGIAEQFLIFLAAIWIKNRCMAEVNQGIPTRITARSSGIVNFLTIESCRGRWST